MQKTQDKTDITNRVVAAGESQQAVSKTARRLMDVKLQVRVLFGRSSMPLRDVLKLASGSLVELDQHPDDDVELVVGDKVIARGQVVVIDGCYGVKITGILGSETAGGAIASDLASLLQGVS